MSELTDLQALVTGSILGCLMKAPAVGLMIDAEPVMDGSNFTEKIRVIGRESGENLLVVVMKEATFPTLVTGLDPLRIVK